MKPRALLATVALSASLVAAPALVPVAVAQTAPAAGSSYFVGTILPVVLWAATGAVIGAVAWPMLAGPAAAAAPGVMSLDALANTGAAAGAVLGGVGYLLIR